MMKSNFLFFMMMIFSTSMTLSSENWLSMWVGMEMNMMSFIPLMNLTPTKKSSEASMIYFLTQSISSIIMLSSIMMYSIQPVSLMNNILIMSIMIKLGSAPFHLWVPKIVASMSWTSNMIMLTWQKIAPLYMMNMINYNIFIKMSIIMSVMIGSFSGLYQNSLRKMMAYSSLSHMGWIMSLNKNKDNWTIYLSIYSFMTLILCQYLNKKKILFISQLSNLSMNTNQKFDMIIFMMSFGGLPPMMGFLPKWMVIEELIYNKSIIMMVIMILTSMMTLFFYLRITYKMIMIQSMNMKWSIYYQKPSLMIIMMNFMLPMIILLQ
uniref:NADH dehydrogenase subunit 2 n=1 Tax=Cobbenicoris guangxiensis TaxID=3020184 RepID=UPI002410EA70|nr:NADH dehydrogenase subunit 2 [Cobbenicoris guangxiensis]WEM32400.1 NADH dehydrogenase subunit 2 [Cobbenicoris guangxiensis]